ncbi:hypothetical protein D9M73_78630 [compost metagenome]
MTCVLRQQALHTNLAVCAAIVHIAQHIAVRSEQHGVSPCAANDFFQRAVAVAQHGIG